MLGLGLWFGPLWFTIAMIIYSPLMALARTAMGVHYILDVVAGYVLGLIISIGIGATLYFY